MVIVSSTAIEPYKPVTQLQDDITITSIKNADVSIQTPPKYLYLIVKDDWFDLVEIKAEGDLPTGISLKFSFTDAVGKPLGWTQHLKIKDAYANHETLVYPFGDSWFVLDDMFIVKDQHGNLKINVYGTKYVTT